MTPAELIHLPHMTACGTILGYLHQLIGRRVAVRTLDEPGFVQFEIDGRTYDRQTDTLLVNDDQLRTIACGIAQILNPSVS